MLHLWEMRENLGLAMWERGQGAGFRRRKRQTERGRERLFRTGLSDGLLRVQ